MKIKNPLPFRDLPKKGKFAYLFNYYLAVYSVSDYNTDTFCAKRADRHMKRLMRTAHGMGLLATTQKFGKRK
jgi:hypothetical protein